MLAGVSFSRRQTQLRLGKPRHTKPLLFRAFKPADLSIEMLDLHITAIHELARGLKGLRIGVGLDGFVRRDAIVSIDHVCPIRRHGVLLLGKDNASGMKPGSREPCGNRMEQRLAISGTERKLLRPIGIIESAKYCGIWNTCGYLEGAGRTLPPSGKARRPLHPKKAVGSRGRYETRIAKLEPQPSIASRIVRSGGPETA